MHLVDGRSHVTKTGAEVSVSGSIRCGQSYNTEPGEVKVYTLKEIKEYESKK